MASGNKFKSMYETALAAGKDRASKLSAKIRAQAADSSERETQADLLVPAGGSVAALLDSRVEGIKVTDEYSVSASAVAGVAAIIGGRMTGQPMLRDLGRGIAAGAAYAATSKALQG